MPQPPKPFLPDAALVESMTEAVLVTTADLDAPGPHIVYVNPAFERMTGWSRHEIIGRSPSLLQGPKTSHVVLADIRTHVGRDGVWEGQVVNYRKDGSEFVMEWSIVPLRNSAGGVIHYLAVQRDVTVRVKLEQELAAARQAELEFAAKLECAGQQLIAANEAQQHTLQTFIKYVPESVVRKAIDQRSSFDLEGGDLLHVAILFCDLCDFTGHCESLSPDCVVRLLNTYYRLMAQIVQAHGGVIQQFVGDEIFVIFGAPIPMRHVEEKAVRCAVQMVDQLAKINEVLRADLGHALEARIGIDCGTVVAGNLGSEERLSYSVVGDVVNTAKRIESLGKARGNNPILISEAVQRKTASLTVSQAWPTESLRGKQTRVNVYQVLRLRSPECHLRESES